MREREREGERSTETVCSKGKEKTRSERTKIGVKEVVKRREKKKARERWKERKGQKMCVAGERGGGRAGASHQLEHCGRLRIRASRATGRDCVWVPVCT